MESPRTTYKKGKHMNIPWQLLIVIGVFLHGARTVFNKKLTQVLSPVQANFWSFVVAVPIALLLHLILGLEFTFGQGIYGFLFIGAFIGIAMWALFEALAINVHRTSLLMSFNVVVTIVLAVIFLGEWQYLNPQTSQGIKTLLGIVLAGASLMLLYRADKRHGNMTLRWLVLTLVSLTLIGFNGFLAKFLLASIHPVTALLYQLIGSTLTAGLLGMYHKKIALPAVSTIKFIFGRSVLLVLVLYVSYQTLQIVPATIVTPTREIGWVLVDVLIGLYIFHEHKQLTRLSFLGILVGIGGGVLLAL